MRWGLMVLLLAGCVTPPAVRPEPKPEVTPNPVAGSQEDPHAGARAVVESFISAAEGRRFKEVLALLSKPLRDRYSAEQLERDFGVEPLAAARVAQIRVKLAEKGLLSENDERMSIEWAAGRKLRLVYERDLDGWRIAALE